jgi:YfiH family protein
MRPNAGQLFTVMEWEGNGMIAHGFGTRGESRGELSKKDWPEQPIVDGEEIFPLISVHQVHGDRVLIFGEDLHRPEEFWDQEGDALITRLPGYALGVFTADCLPILLFDSVQEAVGVVHAGWRGTAKGITRKTVEKMEKAFHSRSENILAALGPAIGPCCYEVDAPVREAFSVSGLPWESISSPRKRGKWLLDLYQANLYLLEIAGVRGENIHSLKICTSCHRDLFSSYRAEGKIKGEQLSFIARKRKSHAGAG